MKTKLLIEKGRTSLVVDHGQGVWDDKQVLAAMTNYDGTHCWTVIDIRLTETPSADPWSGSGYGEDFYSQFKPKSEAEANAVKALLEDYQELADGTLIWCTYKNIVRGHFDINGSAPGAPNGIKRPIYHRKADPYSQPGASDIPVILALNALYAKHGL